MSREPFSQVIRFVEFDEGRLATDLRIKAPPYADAARAHTQLKYLAAYVADDQIRCKSLLIEEHYIDRDHMEDHSVFYSRNLYPYENVCQRVHFFRLSATDVESHLTKLREIHRTKGHKAGLEASAAFSEENYIGFAVIKPLQGTPVGRTILRSYPREKPGHSTYHREFTCTQPYPAHVGGITLSVRGLPFQQQDKAVSACATTAIWSALHRTRAFEDIGIFTPAQITAFATRASLEYGRSMPSEGLSTDQMCQAVQGVGISPILINATDPQVARAVLYSSLRSGIAPVLVITNGAGYHAVTAVGMGMRDDRPLELERGIIGNRASHLEAIYVHDDRIGPYVRADLAVRGGRHGRLFLSMPASKTHGEQWWSLTHLLFPIHAKVRITFGELTNAARTLVAAQLGGLREELLNRGVEVKDGPIEYETWIERAESYLRLLLRPDVEPSVLETLSTKVAFSRYVGVIRVVAPFIDPIHVLIDTTSTERNSHVIAVLAEAVTKPATKVAAQFIASYLDCSSRLFLPDG